MRTASTFFEQGEAKLNLIPPTTPWKYGVPKPQEGLMEIQLVRESWGENDKGVGGLTFMLVLMVRRG
jgi:hypothetical protein